MLKYLYNTYPLVVGVATVLFSVALFSMLTLDFEKFNSGLSSLFDIIWFVFITVMTIGYGEISAISIFGQVAVVIATFVGLIFNSIFVVVVEKFLKFDLNER